MGEREIKVSGVIKIGKLIRDMGYTLATHTGDARNTLETSEFSYGKVGLLKKRRVVKNEGLLGKIIPKFKSNTREFLGTIDTRMFEEGKVSFSFNGRQNMQEAVGIAERIEDEFLVKVELTLASEDIVFEPIPMC